MNFPVMVMMVVALYFAATVFYVYYFVNQSESAERAGLVLISGGFAVHTVMLAVLYYRLGRFPVIGLKESLCFFSWGLSALYLMVRYRGPAKAMGVFLAPMTTAFFLAACFMKASEYTPDPRFDTALFPIHILFAFLGYAAFAFSSGSSIMYLLQERGLKDHHPGPFMSRLPSLQELDMLTYHSLTTGFFLLSLGLVTGALWLHNVEGLFLKWDPKVVASMVTWILYAAILHTRLIAGWRGKRTAVLSIAGFCCVLVTFLGIGLIKTGFHNFF